MIFGILFAIKHEHVSFAALDHTLMIPVFLSVAYEILWKTELAYSGLNWFSSAVSYDMARLQAFHMKAQRTAPPEHKVV